MSLLDQFTVITDEISQDFEEALQVAQKYGIKDVEIRKVWDTNISMFSDEQLEEMKKLLDTNKMGVSMISGPFAKCLLPGSRFDRFKKKENFNLTK